MPVINTAQENFRRATALQAPSAYATASSILLQAAPSSGASGTGNVLLWDVNTSSVSGTNPSLLYVMPFMISATSAQSAIGMRLLGWRKYLDTAGTLAGVTIADTAGNFTCNANPTLAVGQAVTIAGTFGGTGTITVPAYSSPTTYYIIATNGSGTFQLSATLGGAAITTTSGTPTGVTYTRSNVSSFWYMPTVLADFTLGFTSGTVPNYPMDGALNTRTFSSITQVSGTPAANLYSPATAAGANVEPAYAMVDVAGASYVTAQFKASAATDMGTFWANL
jgi:hypothetical protein